MPAKAITNDLGLMDQVDYLAASEKFARDYTQVTNPDLAVQQLQKHSPNVVATLGARGLAWCNHQGQGRLPAFAVEAVDTTGAGDAFHGVLAHGIAMQTPWERLLLFASAAAALCCTQMGSRKGLPSSGAVERFFKPFRQPFPILMLR